jgi:ribose 5-phosphate isomerase RpiB
MKLTREMIQVLALCSALVVIWMITDVIKLWMTLEYEECDGSYSEIDSDS